MIIIYSSVSTELSLNFSHLNIFLMALKCNAIHHIDEEMRPREVA